MLGTAQGSIQPGEKHGVSFEEAQTVFLDENARLMDDPTTLSWKIGSCCWVSVCRRIA
jgi:hypothetical protein